MVRLVGILRLDHISLVQMTTIIAVRLARCFFSGRGSAIKALWAWRTPDRKYLPLLHFVLLGLVLFHQIVQNLLEAVQVGLKGGDDVLHRSFNEDAINHAKALSVLRNGTESFEHKPNYGEEN